MSKAQQAAADPDPLTKTTIAILEAVKQWETARLAGAFSPEVKAMLRDNAREFHLEPTGDAQWDLHPIETGNKGKPIRLSVKKSDDRRS